MQDVAVNEVVNILINEYQIEEYQDVIDAALDKYVHEADGGFDLAEIAEEMYSCAKDYIDDNASNELAYVKEIDEQGNVISTINIPLDDILKHAIDLRRECDTEDCDVGGVVESSLELLQSKGKWFYGLKSDSETIIDASLWPSPLVEGNDISWKNHDIQYEPIMWFSTSEKMIQPWMIFQNMDEENINFWFETDEWHIMEYILGESADSFLTWYFPECGRSAPDVEEIRKKCPVMLSDNESSGTINKKLNEFLLEQYKKLVG